MAYKRRHKTVPICPWQWYRLGFLKAPDVMMCPKPECFSRFPDCNVGWRASLHGPHLKCSTLLTFADQLYFCFEGKLLEWDQCFCFLSALPVSCSSSSSTSVYLLPFQSLQCASICLLRLGRYMAVLPLHSLGKFYPFNDDLKKWVSTWNKQGTIKTLHPTSPALDRAPVILPYAWTPWTTHQPT